MSSTKRPSHRLMLQPDEESKFTIEVGALWPHEKGGGFSVTLKRGLALYAVDGARLVAFTIRDDEQQQRDRGRARDDDEQRERAQTNRQRSDRGYSNGNGRGRT